VNGGSQISRFLAKQIREYGGIVITNQEVINIVETGGKIDHVETKNGRKFYAKQFISNMHPVKTLDIMQTDLIRSAFRNRLKNLENSISCFSVNVVLKKKSVPYFLHNYYWHKEGAIWDLQNYTQENWPLGYALFFSAGPKSKEFANALTIMTYMRYEEVKQWGESFNTVSNENLRGEDYEQFKEKKAAILINSVSQKFPGLKNSIQSYYAATPLSYRDYIGSDDGSLYGITKDHQNPLKSLIAPHTRLPNFFFTGQNLNLHGVLGATITAMATCTALMGNEDIIEKIRNA
jgi:all-trans-retinol 13,14-reductase